MRQGSTVMTTFPLACPASRNRWRRRFRSRQAARDRLGAHDGYEINRDAEARQHGTLHRQMIRADPRVTRSPAARSPRVDV
jgi:hypothetical protein